MKKADLSETILPLSLILFCAFLVVVNIVYRGISNIEERGYYLGLYQYCMDTEPQRYTIAITNNSNLPEIRDFSPICLEIAREYVRRNDYELEHRGWQWPLE